MNSSDSEHPQSAEQSSTGKPEKLRIDFGDEHSLPVLQKKMAEAAERDDREAFDAALHEIQEVYGAFLASGAQPPRRISK